MELTREKLLHVDKISADPEKRELASALFAEIDKPKVWDKAPDDAIGCVIYWRFSGKVNLAIGPEYTRELPKARIDEIAEEAVDKYKRGAVNAGDLKDIIKTAILKDREDREANR